MHEYPWVWLRDNCQSEESFEAVSQCRIINLTEWDLGIRPKHVQVKRLVTTPLDPPNIIVCEADLYILMLSVRTPVS